MSLSDLDFWLTSILGVCDKPNTEADEETLMETEEES
jgi:hypothetical protein